MAEQDGAIEKLTVRSLTHVVGHDEDKLVGRMPVWQTADETTPDSDDEKFSTPADVVRRVNAQNFQPRVSESLSEYPSLSALLTAVVGGELGSVPAGLYSTVPVVIDLTGLVEEPMGDQRRPSLQGAGAGSTVIKGSTVGEFALTILGGTGVASHSYQRIGGFTIGRDPIGANGLKIKNLAFGKLEDVLIQSCDIGLDLESVLSSVFNNIIVAYSSKGIVARKGSGFSDINANLWTGLKLRSCFQLGAEYGPASGANFASGSTEGCGSGGVDEGGWDITVSGAEGSVGANFNTHYFEINNGGFDVRLTNIGSEYVTHRFTACNFNRISAADFVTNNVQCFGKNVVAFDGCTFDAKNDYVRSALRKIAVQDGATKFIFRGCVGHDQIDGGFVNEEDRFCSGSVAANGSAVSLPTGWSCLKAGTGVYVVTHNLDDVEYTVTATAEDADGNQITQRIVNRGANAFQVITTNQTSGALVDLPFMFQMHRYAGRNT